MPFARLTQVSCGTIGMAAMVTDSSAVCIQRAVRAYMIRTVVAARLPALAAKRKEGRPMKGQLVAQPAVRHDGAASCSAAAAHVHARHAESSAAALSAAQAETDREAACGSSHVTPPPGGQAFFGGAACTPGGGWTKADGGNLIGLPPTPYRAGRSPPPGSFASPVRRTPPGGGSGLPPMTPVAQGSRGPDAAEPLREQVLTAWKKGIEDQVSLIHEKLIDSARKGSARSRSRSPAPGGGDEVKVRAPRKHRHCFSRLPLSYLLLMLQLGVAAIMFPRCWSVAIAHQKRCDLPGQGNSCVLSDVWREREGCR
jgi:hypothetical protein